MEIRCRCTGCSARFKVEAKYAGKKARCPKCQAIVDVPLTSGEETVSVTPVVASTPSTPAPTGAAKVAPKSAVITTAIPVPKRTPQPASASLAPAVGNSSTQVGNTGSTIPSFESPIVEAARPANQFPSLNTAPATSPTPSPAGNGAGPPRGRKKANLLPLFIGGALTVIAAAVAIVFIINSGGGKQAGKKGDASTATVAKDATLLLNWPQGERSGGAVVIDGQRRAIAAAGALKFTLPSGEHKVVALRRGYEPFDTTFNVVKGQETTIAPIWKEATPSVATPSSDNPFPLPVGPSVAGFDGWSQNFEAAKRTAAAAKKDLLIVFGCSDNDQETQNLARNLAQAGVQQSHVCVVVDFPDTTRGLDVVADLVANNLLAQQFGVKGVPSLALADDQGRAFFLKRDWSDGFGAMPTKIPEWSKLKAERDALLAAAGTGKTKEQLDSATKAVRWLKDNSVQRSHAAEIKAWFAAAQKVDAENQGGLLEVLFEPQWLLDVADIRSDDVGGVDQVIGQLDPWVARRFQDHDRGAKLHMMAAYVLAQLERFDEAATQVEHAGKYEPKDATLASAIEAMKRDLAMSKLLGTGTGFLISAAGYVLTNHHVIEGDGQIEVRLYDQTETLAAKIVKSDAQRDIALLQITLPEGGNYKPLPVAVGKLEISEEVAVYGHPLGDRLGEGVKFSKGTINGQPVPSNGNMLLLDMTINPGNSGGPLCDTRANVVGMVTAKFKGGATDDSIGLAIPAEDLEKFLVEHLPADAVRPAPSKQTGKLEWPQVSAQVKSGVLMIMNKKK